MIIFTVDVEDWYQVENLKEAIGRDTWEYQKPRVEDNIFKLLELLEKSNSMATFFVLGYIAKRHPKLITNIYERGHEVASHGFNHTLIYEQSYSVFKKDVLNSKHTLEDITGAPVIGYRAPAFSITDWAIDILKECGYVYDSSIFPFYLHSRYGKLKKSLLPFGNGIAKFDNGLLEVPLSMLKFTNKTIPWAGGGYFRLIPYTLFRVGIRIILKQRNFFVFYIHPWEIDLNQPRIRGIKLQYKLRHYIGLKSTYKKLSALTKDFRLSSIKEVIRGGT